MIEPAVNVNDEGLDPPFLTVKNVKLVVRALSIFVAAFIGTVALLLLWPVALIIIGGVAVFYAFAWAWT